MLNKYTNDTVLIFEDVFIVHITIIVHITSSSTTTSCLIFSRA